MKLLKSFYLFIDSRNLSPGSKVQDRKVLQGSAPYKLNKDPLHSGTQIL